MSDSESPRTGKKKNRKSKQLTQEQVQEQAQEASKEKVPTPTEDKEVEEKRERSGTVGADDEKEPDNVVDADKLLGGESDKDEVLKKAREQARISLGEDEEKSRAKGLRKRKSAVGLSDQESIPWYKMRECLMLVLQARMTLKHMIKAKLKEERTRLGALSVGEIQNLLKAQKDEDDGDFVSQIQELKREIINEIRKNHALEKDLSKLDKRIALLIKNKGNISEVLAAASGMKNAAKVVSATRKEVDPRKLEHYQNLFYVLQTEPKYLAQLVYLMKAEQMESFLDTVILTLYGDAFSPREEFLILSLFSLAIKRELSSNKTVSDFLKADSVVPKMVISYNKRKQGTEFLKTVLGPLILDFIGKKDVNLELKPSLVYAQMISEEEIKTGNKSNYDGTLTEDKIVELPEIKKLLKGRVKQLEEAAQTFLDGIVNSLKKLPYGIRWICKTISDLARENFNLDENNTDILRVVGYFVYYRFINLAIVTPDNFEITDKELTPVARKNLVAIAKVLQNLFNFSTFSEQSDKWFMPMNDWLKSHLENVTDYFVELIDVAEPSEHLQVDKYMELTQKTKPVIIISMHEISQTHKFVAQTIDKLAKDKEDPLRVILNDLGEPLDVGKDDDREIQLTLTNRFTSNVEEDVSASAQLYAETKQTIINIFKVIPVNQDQELTLLAILELGKSYAENEKNKTLIKEISQVLENIKSLETEGLITKSDDYATLLRDVALEVVNREEVRESQRTEIKRLKQTLRNLQKHQKYLKDQIKEYEDYLAEVRLKQYAPKKKKKTKPGENPSKQGPFKFSYSELAKKGVIIDIEIPAAARKKATFLISSEMVGVFEIEARIGGIKMETMQLELDDLLERNYNNITRLDLDQVTLDVNLTIHLLNKLFFGK